MGDRAREHELAGPANGWGSQAARARVYLAAGAWQSAHDLLWPAFRDHWRDRDLPLEAVECLCLLLGACSRLGHNEHLETGCELLRQATVSADNLTAEARVLAALTLAQEETHRGAYGAARVRLDAAHEAGLGQASACTRARVALLRGRIEAVEGHENAARERALEAATLAAKAENESLAGDALSLLAIVARRQGSLAEAGTLYAKAAHHYWRAGNLAGSTVVLLNRAWAVGLIGFLPISTRLFEEALQHAVTLGRKTTALLARLGLGWVAVREGELAEARARLLAAWREARHLELPREEGLALQYLCETYLLSGTLHKARVALRLGQRLARRLAPGGDLALEMRIKEALLHLAEGRSQDAVTVAEEACQLAIRNGARWEEAQAQRLCAMGHMRAGSLGPAREAFVRAREILIAMGEQLERLVVEAHLRELGAACTEARTSAGSREDISSAARFWLSHPLLGLPRTSCAREPSAKDRGPVRNQPGAEVSPPVAVHPVWRALGLATQADSVIAVLNDLETFSGGNLPVLILGETGSGKDLLAQGVHRLSGRPGQYVPINCAAASRDLFVAELFGAQRGAFTGAVEHRSGLISEAENGTLFLDEIADLEPEAQGFLLRFLDSGEVRPLGSTKSRRIATRIVTATCLDLAERVAEGRFRPDLYGRLAGLIVRVPALRERPDDIEPIFSALWQREGGAPETYRQVVTPPVLEALRSWPWPGNVRELRHAVARAMQLSDSRGVLAARADLLRYRERRPSAVQLPSPALMSIAVEDRRPPVRSLPSGRGPWDPQVLRDALRAAGGRVSGAADILGISRSHAYRLYKRLRDEAS